MTSAHQRILFLLSAAAVAVVQAAFAQIPPEWRSHGPADGLPSATALTVSANPQGRVFVTHPGSNSVSELDGYGVSSLPAPPLACGRVVASPSGQLWAAAAGALLEFQDGAWTAHRIVELREVPPESCRRMPLLPLKQGRVLFLLPDRLLEFNTEDPDRPRTLPLRSREHTRLGSFLGLNAGRDGGVWISGTHGVANISGPLRNIDARSEWREILAPEALALVDFTEPQPGSADEVIFLARQGASRKQAIVQLAGTNWSVWPVEREVVRFAWRGFDGALCAATSESLLEFSTAGIDPIEMGRPPWRRIFDVCVEPEGVAWIATTDGLYRRGPALWRKSGRVPPQRRSSAEGSTAVPNPPPAELQLGRPLLSFTTRNRDVWVACEFGMARHRERRWDGFPASDRSAPAAAEHFLEMPDEQIWCAAAGKIWQFDGQHWSVIRGGGNPIKSLVRTRDGTVWVATETGVSRFSENTWIDHAPEDGLPDTRIDALLIVEGQLWATTVAGAYRFHSTADTDAPRTAIRSTTATRKVYDGGSVTFGFDGADRWKLTRPERLLYSHRLDLREWSPFQELKRISFAELSAGKHTFQVRAMDRNGIVEFPPARLDFTVILPWYRELRVVGISAIGGGVALFFAGLAWNRHRQLRRSYAEIELKIAERTRQLETANRELLHSQKMTALGTLAAGIAHDFNNILSIVKGSAQIIEDNLQNPQKIRTRVDRIKTVVDQGSGIVKAMLGFSRESDQNQTPCSINEVVEDTLKLLGDRFLREVDVAFEPGTHLPEIVVSKDFVQQILLNFIFNAAEAMTGRKRIVVRTETAAILPETLSLSPRRAQEYVAVRVEDSGCGIPAENLTRIFEPFFTTKAFSTRHGTGLGLSMVYELAKKLEAGLAVESSVNRGSTFTLFLPTGATA